MCSLVHEVTFEGALRGSHGRPAGLLQPNDSWSKVCGSRHIDMRTGSERRPETLLEP